MDPAIVGNLGSLAGFLPELALTVGICAVFLADVVLPGRGRDHYARATLAVLALTLVATLVPLVKGAPPAALFNGLIVVDPFGSFFKCLFVAATAVCVLLSMRSPEAPERGAAEFYALLLGTTLGMFVLASSNDILVLYLSLELVSLTSYVLTGWRRGNRASSEAALKYVVYGGAASGAMLYGLSLLYGLTGATSLPAIRDGLVAAAAAGRGLDLAALLGITLSLAGFGYKIAAVPFHMWAPDVYHGAPAPVTAFFSVGPKAAGFAALTRFFFVAFVDPASWSDAGGDLDVAGAIPWPVIVGIVAAFTMTVGNVAAVGQKDMKRLLAYSSIAHAGYMLLAFVSVSAQGLEGLCFYLVVYLFMNFGAWATAIAVGTALGSYEIEAWKGFGYRNPIAAAAMCVFLFSLTGLPPLAGFIGKFYIFYAVIARGGFWLVALGVWGVLNSVISLYYYAYVVKKMFLEHPDPAASAPVPLHRLFTALQVSFAVPTLVLGVWWGPVYAWVKGSIRLFI